LEEGKPDSEGKKITRRNNIFARVMRAFGCHACSLMSHSTGRPARRQHALFSPATLGGKCETAAGAMYSDDFLSDLPPSPHIPNASHHVRAAPPHEHGGVFDDVKIVL
jgi:hypothetical protein